MKKDDEKDNEFNHEKSFENMDEDLINFEKDDKYSHDPEVWTSFIIEARNRTPIIANSEYQQNESSKVPILKLVRNKPASTLFDGINEYNDE